MFFLFGDSRLTKVQCGINVKGNAIARLLLFGLSCLFEYGLVSRPKNAKIHKFSPPLYAELDIYGLHFCSVVQKVTSRPF